MIWAGGGGGEGRKTDWRAPLRGLGHHEMQIEFCRLVLPIEHILLCFVEGAPGAEGSGNHDAQLQQTDGLRKPMFPPPPRIAPHNAGGCPFRRRNCHQMTVPPMGSMR